MEPRKGGNGRGVFQAPYLHGGAVTSMLSPIHKQGYLGDLAEKSEPELEDLLERQEKILRNRKFLAGLPDKGEKITKFAQSLRELIALKQANVSNIEIDNPDVKDQSSNIKNEVDSMTGLEMDTTEDVENEKLKHEQELKIIERGFDQLTLHEGQFYQVVKKAEERKPPKSRFAMNRVKNREAGDVGEEKIQEPKPHKHSDLTSASVADPLHGSATVISVNECCSLYTAQQAKVQEIQAQHMAERILRKINSSRSVEHPEGSLRIKERNIEENDMLECDVGTSEEYLDMVD